MSPLRVLLLSCALSACKPEGGSPIRIVVGPGQAEQLTLEPGSALAEYIETGPDEATLLLNISADERGCDSAPEPGTSSVGLSVRLLLPGGAKLEPGAYAIQDESPQVSQGADRPRASVTVKLRGRRHELRPGGELELSAVDVSPRGSLSGLLKFESPGDAEHPATRVAGRFLAHFCRVNRLR